MRFRGIIAALFLSAAASAETIPVVVPFPAGGATDQVWRTLEPRLNQELQTHGLQLITEYVTGNGGAIGAARVASGQSKLLFTSSSLVISMVNNSTATYQPSDFVVLGYFGSMNMFVAVPESGPATLKEFASQCRRKSFSYATPGVGSTIHLTTAVFLKQLRCDAVHVPYKSTTPALPDLVAGRIDFVVDYATSATSELVKQGKLKNIATLTTSPVKNWHVLVANKDISQLHQAALRQAIRQALTPNTLHQFQQIGLLDVGQDVPSDFLEQQRKLYAKLYQENIK